MRSENLRKLIWTAPIVSNLTDFFLSFRFYLCRQKNNAVHINGACLNNLDNINLFLDQGLFWFNFCAIYEIGQLAVIFTSISGNWWFLFHSVMRIQLSLLAALLLAAPSATEADKSGEPNLRLGLVLKILNCKMEFSFIFRQFRTG